MNLTNMAHIYKAMLPHFTTLLEEATAYGVDLQVNVSPSGEIIFSSKELSDGRIYYNTIKQGQNHVGESCFSYKIRKERG